MEPLRVEGRCATPADKGRLANRGHSHYQLLVNEHSQFLVLCYSMLMLFQMLPHMRVIVWLTLLLCVLTTGDLVVDMVFEEPNMVADTCVTAEEPDNAAEHLLMHSQRMSSSVLDAVMAAPDLDVFSTVGTVMDNRALGAVSPPYRPPRLTPVSFSAPLRI